MTNVQAALLLGQLDLWDVILERKHELFGAYTKRLAGHPQIAMQCSEPGTEHSRWMFGIRVRGLHDYDLAAAEFLRAGIETRPMFFPINRHGHLRMLGGKHLIAEQWHRECVILPSWPGITSSQVDHICEAVDRVCGLVSQHA